MTSNIVSLIKETARQKNLGTFEYVLSEAKRLKGSGKDAERHYAKYVLPKVVSYLRASFSLSRSL